MGKILAMSQIRDDGQNKYKIMTLSWGSSAQFGHLHLGVFNICSWRCSRPGWVSWSGAWSSGQQWWKENTDILVRSRQSSDLGPDFLFRNTKCFDNFSFFQANFPAVGTSPKEGLLVQCTNGGQYNFDSTSHPAPGEARLKGNTWRRAGHRWCCASKRWDPWKKSCYEPSKHVRESIKG